MAYSRRTVLGLGSGALLISSISASPALSSAVEEAILALTGGAKIEEGGIELITPEIAENGNSVPIEVDAPGAKVIHVFATNNPRPGVAKFKFGPLAGSQFGSTRIRLMKTQEVVAIASMQDGSFRKASNTVKVTIGGCGG